MPFFTPAEAVAVSAAGFVDTTFAVAFSTCTGEGGDVSQSMKLLVSGRSKIWPAADEGTETVEGTVAVWLIEAGR